MEPREVAPDGYESWVHELFDFSIPPEEFAARHYHEFHQFSFSQYKYADPAIDAWIQRLGEIFFAPNNYEIVSQYRSWFLTEAEIRELQIKDEEPL